MDTRQIQCAQCNRWMLEKDYVDHMLKLHPSQDNNDKHMTTDDSGRLISIEEYAEIHGEKRSTGDNERNYHDGDKFKKVEQANVFQKIANIKEKAMRKLRRPRKIECRYCHEFVGIDKLREHNKVKHSNTLKLQNKPKKNFFIKRKKQEENDPSIAPEGELGNVAEAFRQAFNETRYGGKGMHQRHEWDGKFGSTPLHDDYSDEADSD